MTEPSSAQLPASWRQHAVLLWALAVSVVLHALLLMLRFVDPAQLERVLPAQAMELILVNARTQEAPLRATALAQANLDGGGRAELGQATTPLESAERARAGDALEEAQARLQRLQDRQMLLLAQVKNQLAQMDAATQGLAQAGASAVDQEAKRKALATLVAKIERRIQEDHARPRKRFVSAATREVKYAIYYDRMRQRLESEGTAQFPSEQGRRLYGAMVLGITVNHDGRVLGVEVIESSGQAALDRAAVTLTQRQRFGAFDAALRRETDQLVVISRYQFLRDNRMTSDLVAPS
jgi:periplasmic protein TonB